MNEKKLAHLAKEFLKSQKGRIRNQSRLLSLIKQAIEIGKEKGEKEAKDLEELLNFMIKKKKPFPKIIELFKDYSKKQGKWDENTEWLYEQYLEIEKKQDKLIKNIVQSHPVWTDWLSHVNGVSVHLAGLIIGGFASAFKEGEGIEHFKTVGQAWAFAGLDVKDGKAPKREPGQPSSFNTTLRSILLGRVADSLIYQKGKYYKLYQRAKDEYYAKFLSEGYKIVSAKELPEDKRGKKYEPPGVISKIHLERMARRKMIKIFVSHLMEVWKKAYGLPAGKPYVIDVLGHPHYIPPLRDK